jgi:hydrogenase maturation protein HypF
LNTVRTSSCGRLFDAVAAVIGLRREVTFEGQAAIELEAIAEAGIESRYEFVLAGEELDFRPAVAEIAASDEAREVIAARFHNTVAAGIVATVRMIAGETGLRRVCLSGGTFQNVLLVGRVTRELRRAGMEVFLQEKVPCNDGGIALGQAAIAAAQLHVPGPRGQGPGIGYS